jgi:hypothetical protein
VAVLSTVLVVVAVVVAAVLFLRDLITSVNW